MALLWALPLPGTAEVGPWSLTVYTGQYSNDPLLEGIILGVEGIHLEDSHLHTVALAKTMSDPNTFWQWEIEGQFAQNEGLQRNWETNLLAIFRWNTFLWERWLPTTVAIGEGFSYASQNPYLEQAHHEPRGTHRTLNYLLFEITLAPLIAEGHWSLVARIHHRSGVFGRLHNVWGGSDYVGTGIKFVF